MAAGSDFRRPSGNHQEEGERRNFTSPLTFSCLFYFSRKIGGISMM